MSVRPSHRAIFAAVLLLHCTMARAHILRDDECVEASDFIRNAALSRDNGYSEERFVAHMEDDIVTIQAFPKESRWVVQDDDDAAMLIGAVREVFRNPLDAEEHRSRFLLTCRANDGESSLGPPNIR